MTVIEACRFRPQFNALDLEDQAAMFLNCASVAGPALRECEAKRALLEAWIASAP